MLDAGRVAIGCSTVLALISGEPVDYGTCRPHPDRGVLYVVVSSGVPNERGCHIADYCCDLGYNILHLYCPIEELFNRARSYSS